MKLNFSIMANLLYIYISEGYLPTPFASNEMTVLQKVVCACVHMCVCVIHHVWPHDGCHDCQFLPSRSPTYWYSCDLTSAHTHPPLVRGNSNCSACKQKNSSSDQPLLRFDSVLAVNGKQGFSPCTTEA